MTATNNFNGSHLRKIKSNCIKIISQANWHICAHGAVRGRRQSCSTSKHTRLKIWSMIRGEHLPEKKDKQGECPLCKYTLPLMERLLFRGSPNFMIYEISPCKKSRQNLFLLGDAAFNITCAIFYICPIKLTWGPVIFNKYTLCDEVKWAQSTCLRWVLFEIWALK